MQLLRSSAPKCAEHRACRAPASAEHRACRAPSVRSTGACRAPRLQSIERVEHRRVQSTESAEHRARRAPESAEHRACRAPERSTPPSFQGHLPGLSSGLSCDDSSRSGHWWCECRARTALAGDAALRLHNATRKHTNGDPLKGEKHRLLGTSINPNVQRAIPPQLVYNHYHYHYHYH